MHAVIVGAGTFGASLAWWLARSGDEVTLVDQFAPGDPRATSGGESRLLRSGHGADPDYTASARRARALWRELEAESGEDLYLECGLTWFAHRDDAWEALTAPVLAAQGIPHQRLSPDEGALLFPSWDPAGLLFLLHEPEAGIVRAQQAVQALVRQAAAHGATIERARATPEGATVRLEDGRVLDGDVVVWACGAWLPKLFPDHVPVRPVLAELFFLDGGDAWRDPAIPAFVDLDAMFYGTHDLDGLGVKMAPDFDGPPLDADAPLPPAGAARERATREALAVRFPALADAPLIGSKTCRYEMSIDSHFIAAPHPGHEGVWLLGGGSGHGFKHGPAMAERIAPALRGEGALPAHLGLGHRVAGDALWPIPAPARE
ncbi:MAG TPA: FAD-dependent oxidoreductase [Solirubrobacteraceae bacterium]|nr:FAD-dependent oxidoreductase [Solirubrobacteraceae bacterium]